MPTLYKIKQFCALVFTIIMLVFTGNVYAAFSVRRSAAICNEKKASTEFRNFGLKAENFTFMQDPLPKNNSSANNGNYFGFASILTGVVGVLIPPMSKKELSYYPGGTAYTVNTPALAAAILLGLTAIAFSVVTFIRGEHPSSQVLAAIGGILGFAAIIESLNIYNGAMH